MVKEYIGVYHLWHNYGWTRELVILCSLRQKNQRYLRQATSSSTDYTQDIQSITVSSQPRTNYNQQLKSSFIPLLVEVLPTIHLTQLTPMLFLAIPFCLTKTLTNVKSKPGDWYEVAGEIPQWISTDFTIMLHIS